LANPNHSPAQNPQVLIVGAGPVGLALAIELGQRGVRCLLVERNDRVGYAPRAKTTHVRTREHLRRWGIADKLRAVSPLGIDYPSNVIFCTRLAGYEIARFENAFFCAPGRNPMYSEHAQWVPQYTLEEVLRAHAQTMPSVQLRFNCELESFTQDGQHVQVQLLDLQTKKTETQQVDYLVGSDGARSKVRAGMGASMQGHYGISRHYNLVFSAPGLAQAHGLGRAVMYWQVNGDAPSLLGPMDKGDKWFFMPTGAPEGWKLDPADAPDLIRKATGIDLPYQVLSSDEWVASRLLADSYRQGRVFLAGDACHLHPPFGGYGMNMGVSDGVDLGWKLAAVLQGWGGPALLDTYQQERRPVHNLMMDEAVVNHSLLSNQLWQPGLDAPGPEGNGVRARVGTSIQNGKLREFCTLGVILGQRYDASAVIVPDGTAAPEQDFLNYVQSSRPGAIAPHAWLHDGSSLFDHFGQGFTLLATSNASTHGIEAASRQAREAGVPLKIIQPKEGAIGQLYPTRFTLIRPDQHVAWRGNVWPEAPGLLDQVTGRGKPATMPATMPSAAASSASATPHSNHHSGALA
jgi:2-polyprenyl-6-methoxyphenol hydroxylase-like FAD-dependent oxidoreductase